VLATAVPDLTRIDAEQMLRRMWRIRHFEAKVIELF